MLILISLYNYIRFWLILSNFYSIFHLFCLIDLSIWFWFSLMTKLWLIYDTLWYCITLLFSTICFIWLLFCQCATVLWLPFAYIFSLSFLKRSGYERFLLFEVSFAWLNLSVILDTYRYWYWYILLIWLLLVDCFLILAMLFIYLFCFFLVIYYCDYNYVAYWQLPTICLVSSIDFIYIYIYWCWWLYIICWLLLLLLSTAYYYTLCLRLI